MVSIAITVSINKSIFHQGTNVTAIYLYKALTDAGFTLTFLNNSSTQKWFDHLQQRDFKVVSSNDNCVFDYVIELQWHLNASQRSKFASKIIVFMHYPPLMHDIECSVYPQYSLSELAREHPNEPIDWNSVDFIWTWDCYTQSDIKYLQLITSRPVYTIPIVWNSIPLEGSPQPDWSSSDTPMIHICEGNRNNLGNALIPLTIARALRDSDTQWNTVPVFVHDSGSLVSSPFFKDNILNNLRLTEYGFTFIERKNITSLTDHKSVVLMHQRFRPFRATLFDCLWLGIPVVHNFKTFDYGFKYVDNSITSAIDAFTRLAANPVPNILEQREWLIKTFSGPIINTKIQEVFNKMSIVTPTIIPAKHNDYLHVWFEDFWADFQPLYNFFTLLIESEACGRKWKLDAETPDVVIYGPYTQRHRKYKRKSEGGPLKILFTGENTRPSSEADINLGFDYSDDPNYIRLPLWILEINWFNADASRVVNPKPFPLERLTNVYPDELAGRDNFCGFVVSNPMNPIRNDAFKQLSTYKHVVSGGALFNNIGRKLEGGPGGGGGELTKLDFFKKCKFALVFENAANPGYVTEKILHAKAAGCIPIYWGDPSITREFNPAAFVNARVALETGGWPTLIATIKDIDENPRKWIEMYNTSLFYPSTITSAQETMKKLASIIWNTSKSVTIKTLDQVVAAALATATVPIHTTQKPIEVIPHVWLACAQIASNREWLASNGITHIVNCIAGEGFKTIEGIKALEFPSEDNQTYQIIDIHYDDVKKFVDEALDTNGNVLIHCRAGINRSGALVVAYAAEKEGCSPASIVERISKVRPYILLNSSFRKQIENMKSQPQPQLQPQSTIITTTMSSSGKSVSRRILIAATANFANRATLLLKYLATIEHHTPIHFYQIDEFPSEYNIAVSNEYEQLKICKFAPITVEGFDDYMAPEHYAWKLRLINDEIASCKERTQLLYLDTGMIPMKKDLSNLWSIIETFGALFVNDSTQKNISWCHPNFCNILNVTSDELKGDQLWAGVLGIDTSSVHVKIFKDAYELSKNSGIIKGDKWKAYNEVCTGHRHDQSILSILSHRTKVPRQDIASIYSHISYEDARLTDVEFYVHRGNIIQYIPFTNAVNQAHLIISSNDNLVIFKNNVIKQGEKFTNIYGFSDNTPLIPEKQRAFMSNDFDWKKATVDRTWKHYCLWNKLSTSEHCTSFLIVEDYCIPRSGWKDAIASLPPCDILMLSGSNRAAAYVISMTAIKKLLEHVKHFGLCSNIDRFIRSCELNIVEKQVFDVDNWIDNGESYVCEGIRRRPPVCTPVKWNAIDTDTTPIESLTIFYTGATRESVLEWEYDWFYELMPWLSTGVWTIPTEDIIKASDNIVFIVAGYMPDTWHWVKFASDIGKQFTLLHTSDEWEQDQLDIYKLPGCKHVVRNYWRPNLPEHVITIPLGYKKGMFTNKIKPSSQKYKWSFAGDPHKSGRASVLSTLSEVVPHKIHCTAGWKASNCLTVDEYRNFIQDATFTPCMTGNWNVDCFRIWEALECYSIPIVFSPTKNQPYDYFTGLLGIKHPLIVVNDWSDAASIMLNLQDELLEKYKTRLFIWWNNYKELLKDKISRTRDFSPYNPSTK